MAEGADQETCSVTQAAELLGWHPETVRKYADLPRDHPAYLPNHRLHPDVPGSKRRIHMSGVRKLIERQERGE